MRFGGFPFGFQQSRFQQPPPRQNIDNTGLYKVLGVDQDADMPTIQQAYTNLARTHHPDKGGEKAKFQQIQKAYEILSDKEKRDIYDRKGIDAFESGAGAQDAGDIEQMLRQMMQGDMFSRGESRNRGPQQTAPVKQQVVLTLEDAFNGSPMKIPFERIQPCIPCNGKGGTGATPCSGCKGRGIMNRLVMLGPGMMSQQQVICPECSGQREMVQEKCQECRGQQTRIQQTDLEFSIEKGAHQGLHMTLQSDGNEEPGDMCGDVICEFVFKEHPVFYQRIGADLYYKKTVSLVEALVGVSFTFEGIDKSQITITTAPGDMIKDGDQRILRNHGMPFYQNQRQRGHLVIEFSVQMPKPHSLNKEALQLLVKALPPNKLASMPGEDQNVFTFVEYDEDYVHTNEEGGKKQKQEQEYEKQAESGGCAQV